VVLATKVGMGSPPGLAPRRIREAVEESLRALQTDRIDLYYAHQDDPHTPLEQTLSAFDALVKGGKARHVAASNYSAPRLAEALEVSAREGLARYMALQPHYNLVVREEFEGELQRLCERERLPCVPYFALAQGFLTGKYRPGGPRVESHRAARASAYLDDRGERILRVLDEVSEAHGTTVPAVALAWLRAQPTVAAPIASARTVEQLQGLLAMATLRLQDEELQALTDAGR
jgi:aryl-alcohol dehydrogenase (NADP+)